MKNRAYLAKVGMTKNGWYAIDFPDFPDIHTQCRELMDIQRVAEDSLCNFLVATKTEWDDMPTPSSIIDLKNGEMAVIISADLEAYKKKRDTTPIRKTVSLPQWMVDGAEKKGLSLSKVLQESLVVQLVK